ncbi:MAG: class I SAM-dependent methyltransferase [Bryobacteraceae bacterium]
MLVRPSLHFRPYRYKPHGIGYWSGHIPFACDLIATFRPSIFVELGTHTGESFFAFCQAAVESQVDCRAFAVDTWRGDAHTGAYGDEVFREVDAYAREQYPSFTTLLRMTFDDAQSRFDDGQIDLLHIDGMHTYQAVTHDFDTWWPKVRPGGVIVMHDSFDRHDGFGVWRLLEELRTRFSVSEFLHSHGLGIVVKPGGETAEDVANEMVRADESTLKTLRRYYEVCAGNLEYEYEAARRRRPAEWNVTSQLFWRDANAGFSEESSIRVAHIVGAQITEAKLELEASATPYVEFRLDLTLVFALLELHAIRVLDKNGNQIAGWNMPGDLGALQSGGLHAVLTDDERGVLILDTPQGSQVCHSMPESSREILKGGGTFLIRMRGLDTGEFTHRLAASYNASESRHRKTEQRLEEALRSAQRMIADRTEHVAPVEGSFIRRLVRRFL